MDFVSYETAVRLKDAGFPQSEPEIWQAWYIEYTAEPVCVIHVSNGLVYEQHIPFNKGSSSPAVSVFLDAHVFAPTATDILRELYDARLEIIVGKFRAYENLYANFSEDENPAEALAALWFAQREREV